MGRALILRRAGALAYLAITVKYQGIRDQPLLIAGDGHYPLVKGEPRPQDPGALGLYYSGNAPHLNLTIRQTEQERVLAQVRQRLTDLAQTIDSLTPPAGDRPAEAITALSTEPQALWATADSQATAPADYEVQVQWPAAPGQVLSPGQNPIALVDVADGAHTLTLTVNGVAHQLSVQVNNNAGQVDSQEDLLGRLARAIGGVDPGVSAQVITSQEDALDPNHHLLNRTVRLSIQGTDPAVSFSLADDQGTLVIAYHLASQVPPRAASLRLDGGLTSQAGNDFSLDNGHVGATALDSSTGTVGLSVEAGAGPITRQLNSLITQYNDLIGYLDSHADLLRPSLKDRLARPLEDRAGVLPELGLRSTAQGRLLISELFEQKVTSDYPAVRQALLDSRGWIPTLRVKVGQILGMDRDAFATALEPNGLLEQRRRAWLALEQTLSGIVNGYY